MRTIVCALVVLLGSSHVQAQHKSQSTWDQIVAGKVVETTNWACFKPEDVRLLVSTPTERRAGIETMLYESARCLHLNKAPIKRIFFAGVTIIPGGPNQFTFVCVVAAALAPGTKMGLVRKDLKEPVSFERVNRGDTIFLGWNLPSEEDRRICEATYRNT